MPMNRRRQIRFRPVGFATDSPLEGDGFEPSVPPTMPGVTPAANTEGALRVAVELRGYEAAQTHPALHGLSA